MLTFWNHFLFHLCHHLYRFLTVWHRKIGLAYEGISLFHSSYSLFRVQKEAIDRIKQLAEEFQRRLKKKVGAGKYMPVFQKVSQKSTEKKIERKRKASLMLIVDPQVRLSRFQMKLCTEFFRGADCSKTKNQKEFEKSRKAKEKIRGKSFIATIY
jgi:hypothetical protein